MKTDTYAKILLTVIALCLAWLSIGRSPVHAQSGAVAISAFGRGGGVYFIDTAGRVVACSAPDVSGPWTCRVVPTDQAKPID